MFLDDELYEWTKLRKIEKPEDFQTLVNELYGICEAWWKPKIEAKPWITFHDLRRIFDNLFRFWDFFIDKLEKDNYPFVHILKDCSYKDNFMSDPKLKEYYERGKK